MHLLEPVLAHHCIQGSRPLLDLLIVKFKPLGQLILQRSTISFELPKTHSYAYLGNFPAEDKPSAQKQHLKFIGTMG